MNTQVTVRISPDLDEQIRDLARRLRLKRSDVIRMALDKFVVEFEKDPQSRSYDRVKSLLGSVSSGVADLGERHRQYLLERFKDDA